MSNQEDMRGEELEEWPGGVMEVRVSGINHDVERREGGSLTARGGRETSSNQGVREEKNR